MVSINSYKFTPMFLLGYLSRHVDYKQSKAILRFELLVTARLSWISCT